MMWPDSLDSTRKVEPLKVVATQLGRLISLSFWARIQIRPEMLEKTTLSRNYGNYAENGARVGKKANL